MFFSSFKSHYLSNLAINLFNNYIYRCTRVTNENILSHLKAHAGTLLSDPLKTAIPQCKTLIFPSKTHALKESLVLSMKCAKSIKSKNVPCDWDF